MKIQISPSALKPDQPFDARPIIQSSRVPCYENQRVILQNDNLAEVITDMGYAIPVAEYEFFVQISHPELVAALVKPGAQILSEVSADDMHLLHMLMGVCGEAGELLDALKKAIIYRKPLDRTNVVEELGDLEFYLEGIRSALGITREEVLDANIAKLAKRYAGLNYSNTAAQARADKVEDPYAGWTFESPHFVDTEDCMGAPDKFHRVFAKGPKGEIVGGTSRDSGEQALAKCRENVLKVKNSSK